MMNPKTFIRPLKATMLIVVMVLIFNVSNVFAQTTTPPPASSATPLPAVAPGINSPKATATPLPEINSFSGKADFSFKDIGEETFIMTYPSVSEVYFRLPIQWSLGSPSTVTLHYDLYDAWLNLNSNTQQTSPVENPGQPAVSIHVNDVFVTSFIPTSGQNQTYTFSIPETAGLLDNNPANEYLIRLEFLNDHDPYCNYSGIITIKDTSPISVSYSPIQLSLDVSSLPIPLLQDSSFLPETLYIVIPDNFSEGDLAAATTISGVLGKTSTANAKIEVVKASQATSQLLAKSNAVIIGQPGKNSFLGNLYGRNLLSTSFSGDTITVKSTGKALKKDDGIIQVLPSTFSPYNTFLVLSGGSDMAIQRAANSLAIQSIGQEGYYTIIPAEKEMPKITPKSDILTFQDMGLTRDRTFYGLGDTSFALNFLVPQNWELQAGTALVLNYQSSTNLDPKNSSLSVYLNGTPIGAAVLNLSKSEVQITIPIKKEDIILGYMNRLSVETVLSASYVCQYQPRSFWVSVRNSSFLNLPHTLVTDPQKVSPILHPFYYLVEQPDILFSMPAKPTGDDLKALTNFSWMLGKSDQQYFNYQVSMDPNADLSKFSDMNIVLLGKPSTNPQVGKINDKLPQPFMAGEDNLMDKAGEIIYRLPSDVSIGLVEVIQAPWNPTKGITLLTGTTDQGYKWAIDKATNITFSTEFLGDITFVGATTIKAFQSKSLTASLARISSSLIGTPVVMEVASTPSAAPTITPLPGGYSPAAGAPASPIAQMGTYVLFAILGLGIAILVIAAIRTSKGGR